MRLKPGADTAVMDSTGHVRDHFRRVLTVTRAVIFPLDPKPAQERLLRSYCGAAGSRHWPLGGRTTSRVLVPL